MVDDNGDPRGIRLWDLKGTEQIVVRCLICERTARFLPGALQRVHRVPSDTLVYDLQFRLRCKHCNSRSGIEVVVETTRLPISH